MRILRLFFPMLIAFAIGAVFTVVSPFVSVSNAQVWNQIGSLPPASDLRCAYFWDTAHGVVGGVGCIYTYNSGTWAQASYPEPPETIKSLRLLDGINLYAASGSTCIWISSDQGATWQKTSSLLPNADDIYLGADGQIHGMNVRGTGMMKGTTFARTSPLTCVAAQDDDTSQQVKFSSDGGITWGPSQLLNYSELTGYGCVSDPCNGAFYTITDGVKTEVWKSTDGGNNWLPVSDFDGTAIDVLDGGIDGILYLQGTAGVLRSLNGGQSFDQIGGPASSLDDRRMFAFGLLDRSLIMMNGGDVWIWDEDVVDSLKLVYPAYPTASIANPIVVTYSCSDISVPLVIDGGTLNLCDVVWQGVWTIDSVITDSASDGPLLSGQYDGLPIQQILDTIWFASGGLLSIGQHHTGIHLYMSSSVSGLQDTATLNLSVLVRPDNITPRVSAPSTLALSNCFGSTVPIYLHASGCDSVEFSSCSFTIDKSLTYSTNLTFERTLSPGEVDTLNITFPPQNLNKTTIVYANVKGTYFESGLSFDTNIQIRVTFTSPSAALFPNESEMNFDTASTCGVLDTLVTFTNLGCDSVTVTSDETSWQYGWSADDPTFPFTLPPDSSFSVSVHFHPGGPATTYQSLTYGFEYDGGKKYASAPLTLTAVAVPAHASLSLSDSAFHFGSFTGCSANGDTSITVTNSGCDSLALSSASVDSGNGFSLASGLDTVLGPNESAKCTIHFADSVIGSFSSTLHIHGLGAHGGNEIDTSVALIATIFAGPGIASISTNAIDFGTTSTCEERDSSVTITNEGCDTLGIYGGTFSSLQFAFPDSVRFPVILRPHSTATFPIFTHIDTTGHPATINSRLNFTSDSGVNIPSIALSRSITYPDVFSLELMLEDSSPIKAAVPVYVMRLGTVPSKVDELDFDLIYDDDILSYDSAVQPDVKFLSHTKLANGFTDRSFAMKPANDRDTIATLEFQSNLSNTDRTTISLANLQFLVSGSVPPSCIATMDTTSAPSNFQLELVCGDSLILAAMQGQPPFSIVSVQPNPAQNEILVGYRVLGLGYSDMEIELENILGQTILTQHSASAAADTQHLLSTQHLDVSSIPSGIYYLRLSSNGYVQTRSISIER